MEKAFLLSHIHKGKTCYKLVYAETKEKELLNKNL